ncbi:hypothetical protein JCGZ_21603 [Jatropha curcas]|uniref:Uncharacterized protein n=1 Tax=Jatropha curcas TaxID=180498 RepID=A0A067JBI6_JATCU|nr:precursor of CEP14 [Jatropha curcas]KDP21132.1 hypothetical protein JCGZ_21603 [Jatropha curcas]
MARSSALALFFLLIIVSTFVSNTESRKLLMTSKKEDSGSVSSSFASLVLGVLPKGTVPSSSPSRKGHATLANEQLFQRHLATIDRILGSVPSPGVGH